mgnify:CR=1 FL=1
MARALKLKLDELVFTFDLDMEEYGPEVVDVTGPHLFQGSGSRDSDSDRIEFLEAQVERAIRKTEEDDDED